MMTSGVRRVGWAAFAAIVVSIAAAGSSCRKSQAPESRTAATPGPNAKATDTSRAPLFPLDVGTPDPMVQRLCDALHTLPETRKGQCCSTQPANSLAVECVRTLSASVRDKAIALDVAKVERCEQSAAAAFQGCDWVTPLAPATPGACVDVVQGLLKAGAQCRSSLECGDGLFCNGARPTTPGVCAPPGAAGALCSGAPDTLAIYLKDVRYQADHPECQGFCRGGRCVDSLASGGACSADSQCGSGLRCDAGKCVSKPLAKLGEACTGNACEPGSRCSDGTCVALKKAGEVCTSPFDCSASCVVSTPGATSGICGPQCVASPISLPLTPQRPTKR